MERKLTQEQIKAIEKAFMDSSVSEVVIRVENGSLVVLQSKRKKIG